MARKRKSEQLDRPQKRMKQEEHANVGKRKITREEDILNMQHSKPPPKKPTTKDNLHVLTAEQRELYNNVQEARKRVPRFLFRLWTRLSGGDPRLNTLHAITPLAFLDNEEDPECSYKIDKADIVSVAEQHVGGNRAMATFYSSWTQSLAPLITSMMIFPFPDWAFLSVLDMTRMEGLE